MARLHVNCLLWAQGKTVIKILRVWTGHWISLNTIEMEPATPQQFCKETFLALQVRSLNSDLLALATKKVNNRWQWVICKTERGLRAGVRVVKHTWCLHCMITFQVVSATFLKVSSRSSWMAGKCLSWVMVFSNMTASKWHAHCWNKRN